MAKAKNGQLEMPWAVVEEAPARSVPTLGQGPIARVALDVPLDKVYSYLVPPEMRGSLKPGMLVEVPVGLAWRLEGAAGGPCGVAAVASLDQPDEPAAPNGQSGNGDANSASGDPASLSRGAPPPVTF